MGAHRILDDDTLDVARIVGRGAVAVSAALALVGTGAGLAFATPTHGDGHGGHGDEHGYGSGHGDEHGYGADCEAGDGALVGGVLDGLGLSGSSGEQCGEDGSGGGSYEPAATGTDGDAGARRAAATSESATPTNPDDIPPGPGETKVIDLPDTPQR